MQSLDRKAVSLPSAVVKGQRHLVVAWQHKHVPGESNRVLAQAGFDFLQILRCVIPVRASLLVSDFHQRHRASVTAPLQ